MKTLLTAAIFRGGDGKVEVCAARGGECAGDVNNVIRERFRRSVARAFFFFDSRVATPLNVEKDVQIPRRLAREIYREFFKVILAINFFSHRFRGFRRFDDS